VNLKGGGNIVGLLATFAASALVITVVMLFVTGVAQRGILPRRQRRAVPAGPANEPAPAGATASAAADSSAGRAADPAFALLVADSLRALRDQVQMEQERLAAQNSALEQTMGSWQTARKESAAEADRRLADLAKIYGNMKPEAAARVLARLDDETFERVLARIEKRQAAKILALLDPERVARLTRRAAAGGEDKTAGETELSQAPA